MHLQPGGADNLGFFVPLLKIDEERRLVYLRAAQEVPDRTREIMDYETAKPQFQSWSDGISRATNGLSKGNIRSMHRKDSSAGKVLEMKFNDAEKAVDLCIKVVDDQDWKKCLEGVFTGASIGGGYLKKWADPQLAGHTRYTPVISEISLVDLPCMPTANFAELVKMDGSIGQLHLVGRPRTFAEIWTPPPATFAEIWRNR